ncbi:hypothetical protein GJAV_G00010210 [Gymnothorax javanicus]|nr:hypothetical protein GJAV_G00010210 [Gymnothorax javanicus]
MRVTALLLVSLCAWIHTTESGFTSYFDASATYPEDSDGSSDDMEISGSGDDGSNVPDVVMNTTVAPDISLTSAVSSTTEQEGLPVGSAGEMTSTETPDARSTGAAINVGPTDAAATTKMVSTTTIVNPAVAVGGEEGSTTAALPGTTSSTAAPVEFSTTKAPWVLPVDPLRETTPAVTTEEAEATPPLVMGTSTPEVTESGGATTTPSLLTSSSTTAVPPVVVDTGIEAATRTSVMTEREEEGVEEGSPAPTDDVDLLSGSTLGTNLIDTTPDEMPSGDNSIPVSTDWPQATESAKPANPQIPVEEVIQSRSNVYLEAAIPSQDDDFVLGDSTDSQRTVAGNGSLLERKEVLGGVIAGGLVGLVFAVLLVSLMIYRMKKKDEGSYSLDDHKHPNGYQKARREEEFLA